MSIRSRFTWLLAGAELGHYSLPDEILDAAKVCDTLDRHTIPPAPTPGGPDAAAQQLLTAAQRGAALLTRVREADARAEVEAARMAGQALNAARTQAAGLLQDAVFDLRDQVIIDHLQSAYAKVIAEARKVGPLVAKVAPGLLAVAQADQKSRDALIKFDQDLVQAYSSIRAAWARLVEQPPTTAYPDRLATFAVVRNVQAMWPTFSPRFSAQLAAQWAPWLEPGDTRGRLMWLAVNPDAQAWLPTPAEADQLIGECTANRWQPAATPKSHASRSPHGPARTRRAPARHSATFVAPMRSAEP